MRKLSSNGSLSHLCILPHAKRTSSAESAHDTRELREKQARQPAVVGDNGADDAEQVGVGVQSFFF